MNLRRVILTVGMGCGLCVWGFARSGDEPASAQGTNPVVGTTEEDGGDNHDEAAARYRANQSRHWRQVALGSSSNH